MRRFVTALILTLVVTVTGTASVFALAVPSAPPLDRPVVDQTNTLTPEQIDQLSQKIATSRKEKDYQIGVLMIPKLQDDYLEGYSIKVAREWGVGDKDKSNGVLLLIVKDDRKLRIEVGKGMEGALTDLESGRIIKYVVAPEFKKGNYFAGIDAGITSIQAQVEGKPDPAVDRANSTSSSEFWSGLISFGIFAGIPIIGWLGSILGRSKSWWAGGVIGGIGGGIIALVGGFAVWSLIALGGMIGFGLLFDFLVSRNYKQHRASGSSPSWWAGGDWSGGSGWSGGSDGGGSFGGGDFSGGGASGDW